MNPINRAIVNMIVHEIMDDASSDSSEDEQLLDVVNIIALRRRERKPRIQGYCEILVPLLSDADFKSHYR